MNDVPGGEVLVYEAPDGGVRVDVRLDQDTVWLTQRQMAELFDTSSDNIGVHLKNIFSNNELDEVATAEDFSVARSEGSRRVRQWATATLRELLVRGYTLNRQRFEENAREYASHG